MLRPTRGWRMAYPAQTTRFLSSKQGRFQGMSHGSGQLAGRIAGELSVGVEGDDVSHRRPASPSRRRSTKTDRPHVRSQRVQIGEFSALPFVARPDSLLRVPTTRAMKQEENVAALALVLFVQRFDPLPGRSSSASSSGVTSVCASRQSVSKAKCRCRSWLAR